MTKTMCVFFLCFFRGDQAYTPEDGYGWNIIPWRWMVQIIFLSKMGDGRRFQRLIFQGAIFTNDIWISWGPIFYKWGLSKFALMRVCLKWSCQMPDCTKPLDFLEYLNILYFFVSKQPPNFCTFMSIFSCVSNWFHAFNFHICGMQISRETWRRRQRRRQPTSPVHGLNDRDADGSEARIESPRKIQALIITHLYEL